MEPCSLDLSGSVDDLRHRGRYLFFCRLTTTTTDPGTAEEHQLLFKGRSAEGQMDDAALRELKRSLRPGDTLTVSIHAREPNGGEKACLHVQSATVTGLSIRSNTGIERMVVPQKRQASPPLPADARPPAPDLSGVSTAEGDGVHGDDAPHSERAQVFGDWVLATFAQVLQGGGDGGEPGRHGVLDVAGGKGELSLHLTLAGQRCTLVDPRPHSGYLSKWQRKRLRRSGFPPFEVSRELFGAAGGDTGVGLAQCAALVVAMHPDEATEEIVDAAITARTPFAVVPCCVFSRLFPSRRRPDGRPVTTHADLCEYLRRKHPNITLGTLPFAGKNVVVFCRDYVDAAPPAPGIAAAPECRLCDDVDLTGCRASDSLPRARARREE